MAEGPALVEFDSLPISALLDAYGGVGQREAISIEDEIARCMASEGFEYVPVAPTAENEEPARSIHRSDFVRDAFGIGDAAELWGGSETSGEGGDIESDTDPNLAYWESLSPEEQVAYDDAFQGDGTGSSGCLAQARSRQTAGPGQDAEEALRAQQAAIASEAFEAPEVTVIRDDIYTCLEGQGADIDQSELDPESALTSAYEDEWFDGLDPNIEKAEGWAAILWDCEYPRFLDTFFEQRSAAEHQFVEANPGLIEALKS